MSDCKHVFSKFHQVGYARSYECELCGLEIDREVYDLLAQKDERIAELEKAAQAVIDRHRTMIMTGTLSYVEFETEQLENLAALLQRENGS